MRFSLFFCIALNRKNEIRSGLQTFFLKKGFKLWKPKGKNCGRRKKKELLQIKKTHLKSELVPFFFSEITG